jgi:hypothetical protein
MDDELQTLAAFVALSKIVEVGGLLFVASDCAPYTVLLSNVLLEPMPDSQNGVKGDSVLLEILILSKCACNKVNLSH